MNIHRTLVALVLLAGLIAFLYYYEDLGSGGGETSGGTDRLLTIGKDDVTGVGLVTAEGEEIDLIRTEVGWEMTVPRATRADDDEVEALLNALVTLRVDRSLGPVYGPDRDDFGLSTPSLRIRMDAGQDPSRTVVLGDEVPVGGGRYAAREGSDDVLVVVGNFVPVLAAAADSLRMADLIGIESWRAARAVLERGARRVVLESGEGAWRLIEPFPFPARQDRVDRILTLAQGARARAFHAEAPEPGDLRALGLLAGQEGGPALLTIEDRDGRSVTAHLGHEAPEDGIYARRTDMEAVMIIARDLREAIDVALEEPEGLRDPRPVAFDRFTLQSLRIESDTFDPPARDLEKDDRSIWHHDAPDGAALKSEAVNRLLDALEGLEAERIEEASAARPGEVLLTLTLSGDGEEPPMRIALSRSEDGVTRAGSTRTDAAYVIGETDATDLVDAARRLVGPDSLAPPAAGDGDEPAGVEDAEEVSP